MCRMNREGIAMELTEGVETFAESWGNCPAEACLKSQILAAVEAVRQKDAATDERGLIKKERMNETLTGPGNQPGAPRPRCDEGRAAPFFLPIKSSAHEELSRSTRF
jgi:hypothetical protein